MISTDGPQTNLNFGDYCFMIFWIIFGIAGIIFPFLF